MVFLSWVSVTLRTASILGFITSVVLTVGLTRRRAASGQNEKSKNAPIVSLVFGFGFVLLGILGLEGTAAIARFHAREEIASIKAAKGSVIVNGIPIVQSDDVLSELMETRWIAAHHSHPSEFRVFRMSSAGRTLVLRIGRDSKNNDEYWVFDPEFSKTNEIGRIRTPAFEKFFLLIPLKNGPAK